jgi:hypothetical protein
MLARVAEADLSAAQFEKHGASGDVVRGNYTLDIVMTEKECTPPERS